MSHIILSAEDPFDTLKEILKICSPGAKIDEISRKTGLTAVRSSIAIQQLRESGLITGESSSLWATPRGEEIHEQLQTIREELGYFS